MAANVRCSFIDGGPSPMPKICDADMSMDGASGPARNALTMRGKQELILL